GSSIYLYSSSYYPTKSKSAFRGWSTSNKATAGDEGTTKNLNITASGNKTYYAVWTSAATVTLNATGSLAFYSNGNYVTSLKISAAKGETLYSYVPQIYAKTGSSYSWIDNDDVKWGTSKSTKVANAFFAKNYKISGNISLYAINAATVKITWNANGGTLYNGKKTQEDTETFANLIHSYSTPTKSGSSFVGWSTTKKASGLVDFSNPIYALKKTTYYAIWESGYKITIKANGTKFTYYNGTLSKDGNTLTTYLKKGRPLSYVYFTAEKDGKEYEGLSTTAKGSAIANLYSYYPGGNATYYVANPASYEVTFAANGGKFSDGTTGTKKKSIAKGEYPSLYVTRDGYEQTGWYTAKKGGKAVTTVTKKMTVYAHWQKLLTVTWNANGGSMSNTSYVTTQKMYTSKNTILSGTSQVAYSAANSKGFMGWSTSKKGKIVNLSSYKVTKNVIFYAQWESGDDIGDGRAVLSKNRYTYAGKAVKPSVTVYNRAGKKVAASSYTISYRNNDRPGNAIMTIRGKGKMGGTLNVNFYINYEARSNVKSAKASGKNINVSYSKASYASQYRVCAVNKTTGKTYEATSTGTSATIKKVAKGTYLVYAIPMTKVADGSDTWYRSSGGAGTVKSVTVK
ncbi:MAG: InlB B-repeat-containing protein, partial [Lachnospiraceae bacterium]|nr:InlB B-repeat-containing protein [Lachnospiraceae bacterium]